MYINRSFIVNLKYITEIRQNFVYIADEKLTIARARKKEIMQALAEYMGKTQ